MTGKRQTAGDWWSEVATLIKSHCTTSPIYLLASSLSNLIVIYWRTQDMRVSGIGRVKAKPWGEFMQHVWGPCRRPFWQQPAEQEENNRWEVRLWKALSVCERLLLSEWRDPLENFELRMTWCNLCLKGSLGHTAENRWSRTRVRGQEVNWETIKSHVRLSQYHYRVFFFPCLNANPLEIRTWGRVVAGIRWGRSCRGWEDTGKKYQAGRQRALLEKGASGDNYHLIQDQEKLALHHLHQDVPRGAGPV